VATDNQVLWECQNNMTNAAWWARVVEARTERDDLRPKRVWVLRKDGREAAIDVKAAPGIRAEIVLSVDGGCARRGCSGHTRSWSAQPRTRGRCLEGRGGRESVG
jgi:hypothetical protein